jgi:hypothetical protein
MASDVELAPAVQLGYSFGDFLQSRRVAFPIQDYLILFGWEDEKCAPGI